MSNVTLNKNALTVPTIIFNNGVLSSDEAGNITWDGKNVLTEESAAAVTGEIKWFSGSTTPAGYLVCNGAKVSRTTYANLFAVIGTKWGTGDGSTTFTLPNLINRVSWGSTTAGTYKSAGLPNISGDTWLRPDDDMMSINGPFYLISSKLRNPTLGTFANSISEGASVGFDASKANSIYGASTTVQPPAATLIPIIKY